MKLDQFLTAKEKDIHETFLQQGYIIIPLAQNPATHTFIIDDLRKDIFSAAKDILHLESSVSEQDFFDFTDRYLPVAKANELKLKLIALISKDGINHPALYHSVKEYLDLIVGNEVCMQRSLNMSIQLPKDESALLPLHTDVWSGNSPYEVVFWLPLVNCYKTKSMYVLPLKKSREVFQSFKDYQHLTAEELFLKLEKDMIFLDVPKNHAVIFSHSILHGNRVNLEKETRWTLNIRFKSVLSPLGTKNLGEAFLPINIKPLTRIGHQNLIPQIFR